MRTIALGLWLLLNVAGAGDMVDSASSHSLAFEVASNSTTLIVRPQSPEEAYQYLSNTLDQMSFFDANNYAVALPNHPDFRASNKTGSLKQFVEEVYQAEDFEPALKVLNKDRSVLQRALQWFSANKHEDNFHVPEQYTVVLTLYGPGGSYDPSIGTITLFTTPDGLFKGGGGTHTIIHEMMHIAVEEGLVQQFGLSHWEKERLVDVLTQRELGHLLPDYQLQSQGVAEMGEAIRDAPISELATAVEAYRNR